MKITKAISYVKVIGRTWEGYTAAMQYPINPATELKYPNGKAVDNNIHSGDLENILRKWINGHTGDFETITDFSASLEVGENTVDIPWENDNSEEQYEFAMTDCYV